MSSEAFVADCVTSIDYLTTRWFPDAIPDNRVATPTISYPRATFERPKEMGGFAVLCIVLLTVALTLAGVVVANKVSRKRRNGDVQPSENRGETT